MLFDLPRYASASEYQVSINIVTFDTLIRKQLFAFISRHQNSCNLLMQSLVLSSCFYTVPIRIGNAMRTCFSSFALLVLVKVDFR